MRIAMSDETALSCFNHANFATVEHDVRALCPLVPCPNASSVYSKNVSYVGGKANRP